MVIADDLSLIVCVMHCVSCCITVVFSLRTHCFHVAFLLSDTLLVVCCSRKVKFANERSSGDNQPDIYDFVSNYVIPPAYVPSRSFVEIAVVHNANQNLLPFEISILRHYCVYDKKIYPSSLYIYLGRI